MSPSDDSTKIIKQALSQITKKEFHSVSSKKQLETKLRGSLTRLDNLHLNEDEQIVDTVLNNPAFANRLIGLFRTLTDIGIPLTEANHQLIYDNASQAQAFNDLMRLLQNVNVDLKTLPFPQLIDASKFYQELKTGITLMDTNAELNPALLNLMLLYPQQAPSIADLNIALNMRYISVDSLEEKLNQFQGDKITLAIDICLLTLKKSVFNTKLLEILIRQQQYLGDIYEGATELALQDKLTAMFFEVLDKNPENIITLARSIIMLHNASLINLNDKSELSTISEFSKGTYFLLMQLDNLNLLNTNNYAITRSNSPIFARKEVIEAFKKIPVLELLTKDEANELLKVIKDNKQTDADAGVIVSMLQEHHLFSKTLDEPDGGSKYSPQ
jgi:hypothetical protein